jgi:hypothetical protein
MSWRTRGQLFPAGTSCEKCGGQRRGGGRQAAAIAECGQCGAAICERHARWVNDSWLCTPHAREAGINVKLR